MKAERKQLLIMLLNCSIMIMMLRIDESFSEEFIEKMIKFQSLLNMVYERSIRTYDSIIK